MKYVAQLSSKKCFDSCGFILAKLKVIFPWGERVLLEPSREEGVFSWGLFFLVTRCAEGQTARGGRTIRGGRTHCQDLSRTPTTWMSNGRGGPRLREGPGMNPDVVILPL